jgi:hypothetical protein
MANNPPAFRTTDDKFQVPLFSAQVRSLNNGRQLYEAPCKFRANGSLLLGLSAVPMAELSEHEINFFPNEFRTC